MICSLAAGPDAFIVGRMSGTVNKYTLPYIQLDNKLQLRCRPQQMHMNCDSTRFSIIDINGVLSFFDMEVESSQGGQSAMGGMKGVGEHLAQERKEVWSVMWSSDNPKLCAIMEKNRLFVLNDYQQEEPILTSGYLCDFSNLRVKTVMLDEILKDPEDIKDISEMITHFEAKTLKDTRDFLTTVSLKEAVEFVEKNQHPRLWKLIAETALEKFNFNIAERAFVKMEDYYGIKLCQKLNTYDERNKQKAEVSAWFERYDEAEEIYRTIDRKDLALDMRVKLGDWPRVVQLIEMGAGSDEDLKKAYKNLGDYSAERGKWMKAAKYYQTALDNESLVEVYFKLEDFDKLEELLSILPENSPILDTVGERFASMGLCDAAARSYLRKGDVKKAIDTCVLLNQWNMAVELAE